MSSIRVGDYAFAGSQRPPLIKPADQPFSDARHVAVHARDGLVDLRRVVPELRLDFAILEVDLSPEVAVPLGLILKEFVTNSLKYAFDGTGGVIGVTVEKQEGGALSLRVHDNGKGLPSEPQAARPGSGTEMKLIEGLARQIEATPSGPRRGQAPSSVLSSTAPLMAGRLIADPGLACPTRPLPCR